MSASSAAGVTARARGGADIALAALVVGIVAAMIVPLPLALLDVLLALNLSLAVLLLLVALYASEPLRIAAFPTILLVTTLYRLALDVAATRNILGRGDGGEVIRAFGQFVVQGNYVVGAVVFAILTLVQFLVIAKGSERVAEVSARFTLDAMPGKQMAVDAELRAGAIDAGEARRRRRALARESSFYGAMDGAMKFVKGDAVAGIVIAFVNILGGLAIGVGQRGLSAGDALRRYGLLTIGEGLVAQIPALVVSTAAGILVTRVASEEPDTPLGSEIAAQLVAQPRALAIAAVLLALLALTPGMPAAPFALLAVLLGLGARSVARAQAARARSAELITTAAPRGASPGATSGEGDGARAATAAPLRVPIAVEVGEALASLVEGTPARPAPLREQIPALRDALFQELGVAFPGVRVRVLRGELAPDELRVRVHELVAARQELPPRRVLALASADELALRGFTAAALAGAVPARNPDDDAPALWLDEAQADALAALGVPTRTAAEHVCAVLAEALRARAAQFVGIQETQALLDALEATHPALVRNTVPKPVPLPLLAEVLRRLAEERVNLRGLRELLEALCTAAVNERDPLVLADLARQALRPHLTAQHAPTGVARAHLLSADVSEALREATTRGPQGTFLRLDPQLAEELRELAAHKLGEGPALLLVEPDLRRLAWVLLHARLPRLVVLSHAELEPGTTVEPLGVLGP